MLMEYAKVAVTVLSIYVSMMVSIVSMDLIHGAMDGMVDIGKYLMLMATLLLVAQIIQLQKTIIMVGAGAGVYALVHVVVLSLPLITMTQMQLLMIGHVNLLQVLIVNTGDIQATL